MGRKGELVNMTEWHRLFGITVTDLFKDSPYRVELEKDLSLKQQFVDVVIIERGDGRPPAGLPDGLDDLGPHNVLSYKSHQESFTAWACDELVGHYVNYRKQVSPSMDRLLSSEDFQLYGVTARYPEKLARKTELRETAPGIYDFVWGSRPVRLIVTGRVAETERNAVWQLFSGIPERVARGAAGYRWRTEQLSTIIYDLYNYYRLEGISMPYTVEDYYRDFTKRHIDWLTPEERLKGIAPEERLKGIAPEERIKDLSPDALADLLFSDRILEYINPEQKARLLRKLHGD